MDEEPGHRPEPLASRISRRIRSTGAITFAEFMRMALYDEDGGYYRRERDRIGTRPGTDFFTAYSTGTVFADLVSTAATNLLGFEAAADHVWVELGVDRQGSLWETAPAPFRDLIARGYGQPTSLPRKAVLFSNELFDAQPFHRVRFHRGSWREAGITTGAEPGRFRETVLEELSPPCAAWIHHLPEDAPENHTVDLPIGAAELLESLAGGTWNGLFLAFDYGKSSEQLLHEHPQGTLRGYSRHRQTSSILNDPGERDITGHICWDWMREILDRHGFSGIELLGQEAFFVRHAADAIERIIARNPGLPDPDRQRLHQLIHPGNMGQKFQVLSARRK
jgi:SAM-dependent MidA family methyltransferase